MDKHAPRMGYSTRAERVPLIRCAVTGDDVAERKSTISSSSNVLLRRISGAAVAACAFVGTAASLRSGNAARASGLPLLGSSSKASSSEAKETITLVTGCAPRDLIYSLNFDPDTWTGKVGAKLISEGMSSEFLYEKALDMTEVGCGVYTIDYHLAPNAKFGFFLYQVGNSTTKFMSDIGAQVENGPVKQSEIAAQAWANQNKASLENHLDSSGTLEQGEITDAEEDVQYSDLAAYRMAVESGHVNKHGHLVKDADPENVKLAPQMPAGYGQMEYYDWGAWLKYIVHGVNHSENEIECDPSANTCTLQHCSKWQCTDYTKPCQEGIAGCTHPKDFMTEAKLGRLGTVKRYKNPKSMPVRRERRESNKKRSSSSSSSSSSTSFKTLKKNGIEQVGERVILKAAHSSSTAAKPAKSSKKSHRHSKRTVVDDQDKEEKLQEDIVETIVEDVADEIIVPTSNVAARAFHWDRSAASRGSVRRALQSFPSIKNSVFSYTPSHAIHSTPQLGLGRLYPSSLINYMADCNTKTLHVTNNGNANVEYYPRINDISNAGRVYIFGACFNSRNQNTCAVPSDTHPAGCKDATAGSQTNTNTATTTGNTQKGNKADQSTVTKATNIEDETLTTSDESGGGATTTSSSSASSVSSQYTPITNANIHEAVAECLGYEPLAGECPESQFGVMSDWDVSRVTNMDQLFYDPPRVGGDKYKSFDGMLGDWDVSSVTSFEKTFKNANAFKGTNLYNWDVSSATNMHGMFEHAESFVARISGWNVGKVKTMATMFQNALSFNQPLKDWDVSSCKDFARMFSGVREDGFAQDVSSWNVRNDANTNNMFLQNDAYAAKFTCSNADSGPPSSCRQKSVSEMIAEAMMGTDEKGERKSKSKHSSSSSKRRTSSNKKIPKSEVNADVHETIQSAPQVHSTADSEAEDMVIEATKVARGGKSLFSKFGSFFGNGDDDKSHQQEEQEESELKYEDYDEELYGATARDSDKNLDSEQSDAATVTQALHAEQQNSPTKHDDGGSDEGQLGEDKNVDEWGEPTHKYDADPKTTTKRVIRQTGHVDLFGTGVRSKPTTKKTKSSKHHRAAR